MTRSCYFHPVPLVTARSKTACPACGTLYPTLPAVPTKPDAAQLPPAGVFLPARWGFLFNRRRKVKKYLITWNAGYGEFKEVVKASDEDDAEQIAYELWLESAQSSADYSATELTSELAAEHGLDWDEEK